MNVEVRDGAERSLKRLMNHYYTAMAKQGVPAPTEETIVAFALARLEDAEIRKPEKRRHE